MKKQVITLSSSKEEIEKFPLAVRKRIQALISILEENGRLEYPDAERLANEFFAIRISNCGTERGQWRVTYAYLHNGLIVILSAFRKKTQKTPNHEIKKARKRLLLCK